MPNNTIFVRRWASPVGEMLLGAVGARLCLSDWVLNRHLERTVRRLCRFFHADILKISSASGVSLLKSDADTVIDKAISQFEEYFAGDRCDFDIPLAPAGTTFQNNVWRELADVPYGATISYAALATRLGCRQSVRAVAGAVGANALSIIIPCHRIVGADGSLTGYAGGVETKKALLEIEARALFR